jgi:hypothetical protein
LSALLLIDIPWFLYYSSHLPLGVPNGLVIHHATSNNFLALLSGIEEEEVPTSTTLSHVNLAPAVLFLMSALYSCSIAALSLKYLAEPGLRGSHGTFSSETCGSFLRLASDYLRLISCGEIYTLLQKMAMENIEVVIRHMIR